jgi:predicted enzyme related to lactoylglutathione lyase
MLNFNSILIFSDNPKKLADFYSKVFEIDSNMDQGDYFGFMVGDGYITIGPHDKVHGKNEKPERIMFNLETDEVKKQFDRIDKLGARVISKPYQPMEESDYWVATFADPDGNYFQLTSPWKDMDQDDSKSVN